MTIDAHDAAEIIARLGLTPHPEGGHYRETFRDADAGASAAARGRATAIYYLLQAGEYSHWHMVDAAELWLWHAGAPLCLSVSEDAVATTIIRLGPNVLAGHEPQALVPAHAWQSAESLGAWTLVSCVVTPGFSFAGFTLAPAGWKPGRALPGLE